MGVMKLQEAPKQMATRNGRGSTSIMDANMSPMGVNMMATTALDIIADNIKVKLGTLDSSIGPSNFDLIVANIYSSIIIDLLPQIMNTLKPSGYFILSGIPLDKEADIYSALDNLHITRRQVQVQDGWIAITGNKI